MQDLVEHAKERLRQEVRDLGTEYVLSVTDQDLCSYLEQNYRLDFPVLHEEKGEIVETEDVDVDVSWDRRRVFRPGTRPVVKGHRYTLAIPFDGNPDLFQYGTYMSGGADGEVHEDVHELRFYCEMASDSLTSEAVNSALQGQLRRVKEILGNVRSTVDQYNRDLPRMVHEHVAAVRARAEKSREVKSTLAFPLRKKDSPSHPVPILRKPLAVRPAPSPAKPEPHLELQQYDEIIAMLANMAASIERTPEAFAGQTEEFLRDQFLMVLNANFGGAATGETFNVDGKTDILIRSGGHNVFIAECKFWHGPEGLLDTISQLLGYLHWRDTKAAIIIFNRNKDFSAVLAKIPPTVAQHPSYVDQAEFSHEHGFRFRFRHNDDADRRMLVTIIAFDVPSETPVASEATSCPRTQGRRRRR
jgi:hypothetical protein